MSSVDNRSLNLQIKMPVDKKLFHTQVIDRLFPAYRQDCHNFIRLS